MQRTCASTRAIRLLAFAVLAAVGTAAPREVSAQSTPRLNENCIVSVLNRNTRVRPDGSWILPNIPANFGLVRARATCIFNGQTVSGESAPFLILANGSIDVPPIVLGPTTPIPLSLTLTANVTELKTVGATSQLSVLANFASGPARDVAAASTGTKYIVSNPAIGTVTGDGLVTGLASGTVLVQATHEGTAGFISMRVVLSADSDGDGIADDLELTLGLNPNNAADALEDRDRDGLSNRDEATIGTNLSNPDTDGDGIMDGEETRTGADGFITNPLLADTDGDGVRDGLEVASGSDPSNPGSINLSGALSALIVSPPTFTITVNSVQGVAFRQLAVTGQLRDGTIIDLTSTQRGTNYASSDLDVCNFGQPDGRVFGGQQGSCTITITNSGFTALANATVTNFTPVALSFVTIPGFANNVDVSGNFAYVAAGDAGLQVVNVANRAAPVVVGSFNTPGNANDVRVIGNLAYVADGAAGLQIFNVATPQTPVLVGSLDTPGDAWDVVVRDNRAYVADGAAGLRIIDVTNPSAPVLLGSIDPPGTQKGVDVDPGRRLAILASGTGGLHVIDVANPAAPVLIGSLPGGDVRDVALQGTYAYLADGSRSFTSVDLGDPATPILRNSTVQSLGGLLNDVAVQGSFALGADVFFVNGVPVINIDSPANPVPRAILNFSSFRDDDGQGIAADAGYVYLVGAVGSAFIENGTTGSSRMYIGQYIAIEDLGGVAPTISITQPQAGAAAVEGSSLPVRAIADDDIAVASVTFLVNGAPAATVTSEPYEALVTVPPVPGPLVIGARAIDFGGNAATATTVSVAVIPDPLTLVTGLVVDKNGQPVNGAAVEFLTFTTTTGPDGRFSVTGVPTVQGQLSVRASAVIEGRTARGTSNPTVPVPAGTTDVGTITLRNANVLLLVDVDTPGTTALFDALTAAGIPVTRRAPFEYTWNGTNPSLDGFTVVIHLNGNGCCYSTGLSIAGQNALTAFVNGGGGYVGAQWNGFERVGGRLPNMLDLVLRTHGTAESGNCGGCTVTWSKVAGQENHPVLAGLPNAFTFSAEGHDSSTAVGFSTNPSTALMRVNFGGPAVLVRQFGAGRVVDFGIAPNYQNGSALQIPQILQLYINAALWASGGN